MFASGKLKVVLSVLDFLEAVLGLLVEESDGAAAIETVLHLPDGFGCNSALGVAGIASNGTGLFFK